MTGVRRSAREVVRRPIVAEHVASSGRLARGVGFGGWQARPFAGRPLAILFLPASVPILTKDSQGRSGVRLWWHEEDFGMHLAVSCGSGDGGRLDFGTEYAAEAGLAEPDRVAVG